MIGFAAIAASLAAEALAVYVFGELFSAGYSGGGHAVSAVALVVVSLAAFGLPRLVANFDLSRIAARAVIGTAAFVVLYGLLRIEFAGDLAAWDFGWVRDFLADAESTTRAGGPAIAGVVLLVAMWGRSSMRAANDVELDLLPRGMTLPFVAVTALVVLGAASDHSGEIARGGAAFYAAAVLSLACSQLALSGATIGDVRAGGVTAALLGITVGATLACVLVFGLLFGVFGDAVGSALAAVTTRVLTIVLTPLAWALERLFRAMLHNFELTQMTQNTLTQARTGEREPGQSTFGTIVAYGFRALGLLLTLALVAAGIALLTRLRKRGRGVGREGEPGSPERLERGGPAWRSMFRRESAGGDERRRRGIYRLYHDVLDDAARKGLPREPAETPGEFAPKLSTAFRARVTDEITGAFEEARYAGREPDARTLAELERRWKARGQPG